MPRDPVREQIAHYPALPKRASLRPDQGQPPSASPHRAGHYAGLYPEDQPYDTDSCEG